MLKLLMGVPGQAPQSAPDAAPSSTVRDLMEYSARRAAAEVNRDPRYLMFGPRSDATPGAGDEGGSYVPGGLPQKPPAAMHELVRSLFGGAVA